MVIGLGIECTAHTLGIGIVKSGKIIANEKESYSTKEGGIVPMEAAKHHEKVFEDVLEKALKKTKLKLDNFDFIALSIGPGLAPCLLVGLKKAKQLCKKFKLPLVPVNHCIAHLEIGRITGAKNPVMLYVSGANTQIIAYSSGKYRIFGETLDIGVGNFIDNFARYAGIGFPGGPKIQKLAEAGKNYIELPYKVKGMDIVLSGILTNLRQKLEFSKSIATLKKCKLPAHLCSQIDKKQLIKNSSVNKFKKSQASRNERVYTLNDLAYSMQETVFAMLVETAERALAHVGKKELLLGGGVACNFRLQEMCKIMCKERNSKFFCPSASLLVDNGAMIAYLGGIMFSSGIKFSYKNLDKVDIKPRQRTDEVHVEWREFI